MDETRSKQQARDAVRERIVNDPGFALHFAAETGDINLAKINFERGDVDVNFRDETGFTPLFRAVMQKHRDFVSFILDHGADPNIRTREGFTPLMAAAESGSIEIVKMLLDHRADPDLRSMQGATSLHIAASAGNLEIIRLLLNAGADASIRDNTDIKKILEQQTGQKVVLTSGEEKMLQGLTALDVARMCGQHEAEELLRSLQQ